MNANARVSEPNVMSLVDSGNATDKESWDKIYNTKFKNREYNSNYSSGLVENEYGVESEFSKGLIYMIREYGSVTIVEIASESLLPNHSLGFVQEMEELYGLGNATALWKRSEEVKQGIEALFIEAKEEVFEDGMESEFSKGLVSMIRRYGNATIEWIANLIVHEKANPEVSSEALRWLGDIDHVSTYDKRLWLLERSLLCSAARVRDGAALGLASLDDPHSVRYLKQAIQREQCEELREDMEQVLAQLLESEC